VEHTVLDRQKAQASVCYNIFRHFSFEAAERGTRKTTGAIPKNYHDFSSARNVADGRRTPQRSADDVAYARAHPTEADSTR